MSNEPKVPAERVLSPRQIDPDVEVLLRVQKGQADAVEGYQSRVLAQQILADLRAEAPDVLRDWLEGQAENMLWELINRMDRRNRTQARHQSARSVFAAVVTSPAEQRRQAITNWLTTRYVVEDGLRRELGSLRKRDLLFVAAGYRNRAAANELQAAFMEALSRRVGRGTVADHFDEASLAQLYQSCLEI